MFVINMIEAVGTKMQSYCIAMSGCSMYFLLFVNTLLFFFKKKSMYLQLFFRFSFGAVFLYFLFLISQGSLLFWNLRKGLEHRDWFM